jgi:hypothetical protein
MGCDGMCWSPLRCDTLRRAVVVHVNMAAVSAALLGVFVANHSSMIDFVILQQSNCYAVVRRWLWLCVRRSSVPCSIVTACW